MSFIVSLILQIELLLSGSNELIDFNRDIRPILSQKCQKCHGLDDSDRRGKFRIDERIFALKGGKSGKPGIVTGDPSASEILNRISSADESEKMPPPSSKITLSDSEKILIKKWIQDGATYDVHWAFKSVSKPKLPNVNNIQWPINEIDYFILSKIEKEKLTVSSPADKYALIRRVYLDLLGYPPTPTEVDEFINDFSQDSYQKMVKKVLNSQNYGEKWARRWMDLARYSDTNGYEKDRYRNIWPWRDWLINAINSDMPFNEFSIRQLAGDMLPRASASDIIATGFHRNTMLNEEGGIDPLEYRYYAMVDRVNTTASTWLGLTVGCAQCHTHKYDPITQVDYFGLMAFLNNSDEIDFEVPEPSIAEKRIILLNESEKLKSRLIDEYFKFHKINDSNLQNEFIWKNIEKWVEEKKKITGDWVVVSPSEMRSNLPKLKLQDDGIIFVSGDITKEDVYEISFRTGLKNISAVRIEALPDDNLPGGGPGLCYYEGPKGDFFLSNFELFDNGGKKRFVDAKESYSKNNFGGNPASAKQAIDDDLQTGWSCAGKYGEKHEAIFIIDPKSSVSPDFKIKMTFGRHYACSLGKFRISISQGAVGLPSSLAVDVQKCLSRPISGMTVKEKQTLAEAFLFESPELKPLVEKIKQLRSSIPRFEKTLVFKERPIDNSRKTFLHNRGEFLQPIREINPDTPMFLPKIPQEEKKNRLSFAKWIISEKNPLTARVFVNRNWQVFFGRGIVKTTEDFGVQGDFPSHPELLDWLACYFVENQWSMKKLHELIVNSATYKQSSIQTSNVDRENIFLSRGPRVRFDAEMVRDSVLRSCGMLSAKIGGPSVFPPQPSGVTSEGTYGKLDWKPSVGEDRYRRSIYTFSKRTAPFAMLNTFDAPTGEFCVPRRESSNTPLQALSMLNDVLVTESARGFASVIVKNKNPLDENLKLVFRSILTRFPTKEELSLIRKFYNDTLTEVRNKPSAVSDILNSNNEKSVEMAVWVVVIRSILNLDEALVKR